MTATVRIVNPKETDILVRRVEARLRGLQPGSPALARALMRVGMLLEAQAKLNVRNTPNGRTDRWGWPGGAGAGTSRAGLVDSGALLNSIRYEVSSTPSGGVVTIGSYGLVYAAIHELGGVIQGNPWLTIPVQSWSKGRRARDFKLVRIGRKLVDPALMRAFRRDDGKVPDEAVAFILARKAVIPARPYLRPAMEKMAPKIVDILREMGS